MQIKDLEFHEVIPYHASWEVKDSTKINAYLDCPRKFFYEFVLGWRPSGAKQDLEFGEAWHQALEALLNHGYTEEGMLIAANRFYTHYRKTFGEETDALYSPKSPGNAMVALSQYVKQYADDLRRYEVLYTEISGKVPISHEDVVDFRMDAVMRDRASGEVFAMEHKTTKRGGRTWVDQWALAIQVGMYTHVLYTLYGTQNVYGVRVNGAIFKKDNEFVRVPCKKTLSSINVWYLTVRDVVRRIQEDYAKLSEHSPDNSALDCFHMNPGSCTKYWGCPYHDFCTSWSNPLRRCDTVPDGFDVFRWDPNEREANFKLEVNEGGASVHKTGEDNAS